MRQNADAESAGSRIRRFKRLENFNGWWRRPMVIATGLRLLTGRRPRMPSGPGAVDLITQCLLIRWLKAEDTSEKHRQRFASSRLRDIWARIGPLWPADFHQAVSKRPSTTFRRGTGPRLKCNPYPAGHA